MVGITLNVWRQSSLLVSTFPERYTFGKGLLEQKAASLRYKAQSGTSQQRRYVIVDPSRMRIVELVVTGTNVAVSLTRKQSERVRREGLDRVQEKHAPWAKVRVMSGRGRCYS